MKYVFSAIIPIAFLFMHGHSLAQGPKKNLTLEEIYLKSPFRPEAVSGLESMKDGIHYTVKEAGNNKTYIVRYEYKTGKKKDVVLSSDDLVIPGSKESVSIDSYSFSADESKILIASESESIYRRSWKASYYIYERKTKKLRKLSEGDKVMYATFSPDGNMIAYVRNNNLIVMDLRTNTETQVTSDGVFNKIINGAVDWVYEEEFALSRGFEWSPDGTKIAFYRFDESEVKEFSFTTWGELYPGEYRYKYPKAGEKNSTVTVHVYDLRSKSTRKMATRGDMEYIPRIKWTLIPNLLSIQLMNRHQNLLELVTADAETGKTTVLLTEKSSTYIDITDDLTFLKNGKQFVWTSEQDGYNHIYLYNMGGQKDLQLTSGSWDVMEMKGIDEDSKTVYYISTEVSPTDRDLYSVKLDGKDKKKLSSGKGTNYAEFSIGCKYYINTFSDANTPYLVTLHSGNGKEVRVLKDNAGVRTAMAGYNLSKKEFFTFKTSEGIELHGWMIKPPDFNPGKRYPVFLTFYGGPGHNTVNNAWEGPDYFWHQLLAQKGYIVVSVDNRGTMGRGRDFKHSTYKQLGKLETIDQIETAKYLSTLEYVDKARIGVEGWSFGGYLTSLCMTKGADHFKMGIAVAPVTNWRYYDSIYTERFLQTPQENPYGYDDNSPINHVKSLKGKYMIIHGTADDNVHFQNAVEMVNALVKNGKQFDLFFYPDMNHSIAGNQTISRGQSRYHLFSMMTGYILENL
jgi:dipeptidyl-peptidase 4